LDPRYANVAGDTFTGDVTFQTQVLTDVINERTVGAGVAVDGVLLKDIRVYTDFLEPKTGSDIKVGGHVYPTVDKAWTWGGIDKRFRSCAFSDSVNLIADVSAEPGQYKDSPPLTLVGTYYTVANYFWIAKIWNEMVGTADSRLAFEIAGTRLMNLTDDGALEIDTINELTAGAGVTVDGVLCKDSAIMGRTKFIDEAAIADGRILVYRSAVDKLVFEDPAVGVGITKIETFHDFGLAEESYTGV